MVEKITQRASLLCLPVKETSRQPYMQETVWLWSFELLSTHKNAPQPEYI